MAVLQQLERSYYCKTTGVLSFDVLTASTQATTALTYRLHQLKQQVMFHGHCTHPGPPPGVVSHRVESKPRGLIGDSQSHTSTATATATLHSCPITACCSCSQSHTPTATATATFHSCCSRRLRSIVWCGSSAASRLHQRSASSSLALVSVVCVWQKPVNFGPHTYTAPACQPVATLEVMFVMFRS